MRFGIELYWTEEHGGTFASNGKSFDTMQEAEAAAEEYNEVALRNNFPFRAKAYAVN